MPLAPREPDAGGAPVPVKLYLPSAKFRTDEHGRPSEVEHLECVGVFDQALQHWVDQKTGARVYPSQWQPL